MTRLALRFYAGLLALVLAGQIQQLAAADVTSDTETVLNWAERAFPEFFPNHQTTQGYENRLFRFCPDTGIYAGINTQDISGYVMGGAFGGEPLRIGALADLIQDVVNSGKNGSIAACNTSEVPEDDDGILCEPPEQSSPTGIHLLTATEILETSGITIDNPQFSELLSQNNLDSKICIINAPEENRKLTINFKACYDMTAQFQQFSEITGIVITPP